MMEILEASFKLALPVAVLSWFIFKELYSRGELDREHTHKALSENLKRIKKQRQQDEQVESNYLQRKWMRFGGGFYGIAALWTFVAIEMAELREFLSTFTGIAELLEGGIVSLAVAVLVNQITNFVTAMVWFSYWSTEGNSIFVWVIAAYAGYMLGMTLAKHAFKNSAFNQ